MSKLHLQTLPISQLKAAPYNPRVAIKPGTKAWDRLKRSLDEFDLVQPIIWNRVTGHVVGGHQRLEILKARGDTGVDCVVVELPLEREKALNITLNNAEVGSDWDYTRLADLLDELREIPSFDIALTGFDDRQVQDLIFKPVPEAFPGLTPATSDADDRVRATLIVPGEKWGAVEEFLNELLADVPDIELHVRARD